MVNGKWHNWSGFTLIEIMIVIGMLGVLVTGIITVINPLKQIRSANDAKRISDLGQLQKALELYYQDHQAYPRQSANYELMYENAAVAWGQRFGPDAQPYMATLPKSPGSIKYIYYTPNATNPQSYVLYTYLETPEKVDEQCQAASCSPSGISCYTSGGEDKGCNYGVSSPNISPYQ